MSGGYVEQWFVAFLLTQVCELPIYVYTPELERRFNERMAIGFAASAMTHPIVWFVLPPVLIGNVFDTGAPRTDWWMMVAVAETFAFTAEAAWLRAFGVRWPVALATALMANFVSFTLGLFIYEAFGW